MVRFKVIRELLAKTNMGLGESEPSKGKQGNGGSLGGAPVLAVKAYGGCHAASICELSPFLPTHSSEG